MTSSEPHYDEDLMHNPDVAHEHSDINVRAVLTFGFGMAVMFVVCAAIVWVLFDAFARQAAANDPRISPLAAPAGQLPPGPNLLTDERGNLAKFQAEQAKMLDTYGWVDQRGGIARVPISDAKKLLLQRGLPVRSEPAAPQVGTNAAAMGGPSGGRTIK
jgi:hypothetical protein